ncbi:hypothetical protein NM208_g329 [Fusarium decemcellulare]|uniref:Uncharacterized protein n=1 Tax=Fusarium decemcellulare TaxID=57161 RepID=A0ACC1T015_9HYPO|nr:hypothetical protein NM208_g329 [Fusarium decemcellulare]
MVAQQRLQTFSEKPRAFVPSDISNEPDDAESLLQLLLYSDQFTVKGLSPQQANTTTRRDSLPPLDSTIIAKPLPPVDIPDQCLDPTRFQSSIHYLNILSQVEDDNTTTPDSQSESATESFGGSPSSAGDLHHQCTYPRLPPRELDSVDHAFLSGKGVFDLPPRHCIEAIVQGYFEFEYPFAPVLDRVEFLQSFEYGNYSLFLMYAVLASGALHMSPNVAAECGFTGRVEAQSSFSYKATLMNDFQCERNTMRILQGSIILGTVASAHAIDKDFHYWFYNALRLITRTDHHRRQVLEAWYQLDCCPLTCRDVLFSLMGFQRIGLLSRVDCTIVPLSDQDWEVENIPDKFKSVLKPITKEQKLTFVCYLSKSLAIVVHRREQDPKAVIEPLGTWRAALRESLQIQDISSFQISYSFLSGCSYRFECILLRVLLPRWKSRNLSQSEWIASRLRSAMFELDTIIGRLLASNRIPEMPMSFNLCIPILLALHIEIALNRGEQEMTRSISRIFISQSMLLLRQMAEVPPMNGILASFERFLARHRITPAETGVEIIAPTDGPEVNVSQEFHGTTWGAGSFAAGWQDLPDFDFSGDFTGFGFLDTWLTDAAVPS